MTRRPWLPLIALVVVLAIVTVVWVGIDRRPPESDHANHLERALRCYRSLADPAPSPRRLDSVRVLLVEDEPRVREALKLLLARAGADVEAAASAHEARQFLERIRSDVLICDISMPGEDGYTFIRTLRSNGGAARDVPAIALTAYASDRDRERAAAAGFDAHLAKPIQLQGLAAAIDHLLAERRPQIA